MEQRNPERKEPWQMTRDEFDKYKGTLRTAEGKPDIEAIRIAVREREKGAQQLVLQAVKDKPDITLPELEQVTKLEPVRIDGAVRGLGEGIIVKKEARMTPGGLIPSSYSLTSKGLAIPIAEAVVQHNSGKSRTLPVCTAAKAKKLERCIVKVKSRNVAAGCKSEGTGSKECPVPWAVCQSSIGCRLG